MGHPYNTIITINPTQRLTPTRRKSHYLITRVRTSINRLSLVLTVEFSIRQSPNNYPGYPRGRLSVVKYRQVDRAVKDYKELNLDDIPGGDGKTTLGQAEHAFILWRKRYIVIPGRPP
jgi:hypothetical protein